MIIYAAGPDVFRENATQYLCSLCELGEQYGFQVITPFESDPLAKDKFPENEVPFIIGRNNFRLIDQCDIVVANLDMFRGMCIDDGTAVEIGYAFRAGKMICGYTDDYRNLKQKFDDNSDLVTETYPICEPFRLRFNLMIETVIRDSGGFINNTFEDILNVLKILYPNKNT